ncbi:hypothetical protein DFH08DRAFT_1052998 [Mycena albidolilacea]|uniref:Uncharacterized protein n=1 Tax=Mycena albidolilacea TaxID=1033008 RepID=A0AAD7ADB7_9AGAR|nr:hypothetical protein DFH08DRAFT_1052998 [Mycena albidolilacea]
MASIQVMVGQYIVPACMSCYPAEMQDSKIHFARASRSPLSRTGFPGASISLSISGLSVLEVKLALEDLARAQILLVVKGGRLGLRSPLAPGKHESFTLLSETTTLLSSLLTARPLADEPLLATSFGLTVSTLITLPLYQTIIVTGLVWFANCAIFMALATYNHHPHGPHAVQYTAIAQMYLSMAEILYLWARAPTLDAEFDKTGGETVFVVLFKKTSAGRVLALVVIAVLLVGYTVVAAIFLSRRLAGTLKQGEKMSLDPHLITVGLFILVPYGITVGSTELQIRKNQLCLGNVFWGFGQILAITVTIVPVFGTVQTFRKYGRRQRARDLALSRLTPFCYHHRHSPIYSISHQLVSYALLYSHFCLFYLQDPPVIRLFHRKQLRHSSA